MNDDYYNILGLDRNASDKDIRSAYRRLARKHHPDVNPGDPEAEEKFKKINQAYQVLSDSQNKEKYDQYGSNWNINNDFNFNDFSEIFNSSQFNNAGFSFFNEGIDLSSLLKNMSGVNFQNTFRGQKQKTRRKPRKQTSSYQQTININLEDAYFGNKKEFLFNFDKTPCGVCKGIKKLAGALCHKCRGTGFDKLGKRFEVDIPKGILDGEKIKLDNVHISKTIKEKLFLTVKIDKHPIFQLINNNLHYIAKVDVSDCVLGTDINVPKLSGKQVKLSLPPKTKSGQIFRLAGQGMVKKNMEFGDLFVRIDVQIPEKMTDEQIELFNKIRNINDDGDKV